MNIILKIKKNEEKQYLVYVLFNEGVNEFVGTKIKLKLKKILILILNFEFNPI